MKDLTEQLNESLTINESKETFDLQLCEEDGTVVDTVEISIDTHGKDKEDWYYSRSKEEDKKLQKQAHDILVKAHKENRSIMLICIDYDGEGGSETLDMI